MGQQKIISWTMHKKRYKIYFSDIFYPFLAFLRDFIKLVVHYVEHRFWGDQEGKIGEHPEFIFWRFASLHSCR